MAITIQDSRQRTVAQRPVSGQKQSIDTPSAAFGSSNAQATQNLGTALQRMGQDIGDHTQSILDKVNRARALDLQNQMQRELNDFLYNPQEGLLTRKGRNAVSSQALMQQKLGELKTKYMDIPNEAQDVKDMMETAYLGIQKSYEDIATRHAFGESQNYERDALQSRMDLNRENLALDYLNEDNFNAVLKENYETLEIQADREGWSADTLELKKIQEKSALRGGQIAAMIATDRPYNIVLAKNEYEAARARGDFDFQTSTKIETSLNAALPKALAVLEFDNLGNGGTGLDSKPAGVVFNAMINQESRGNQFDKNGNPLTSSAKAVGIAQVVRGTGPEAARLAGLPWDENKWKHDAKYNYALGQAYFEKQVATFGSATLAAMAYNAGPGAVFDFMNGTNKTGKNKSGLKLGNPVKGEVSMDEFVTRFPFKETRDYVKHVTRFSGADNESGPTADEVQARAERLNKIHPDAGAELINMYTAAQKQRAAAIKAEKDQFEDTVHQKVAQAGGDYTVLSASERARAAELGIDYTKYTGVSDQDALDELNAMTSDVLSVTDMTQYRDKLTFDDMNKFREKQQDLFNPESKFFQGIVDDAANYFMLAQGADLNDQKQKQKLASLKTYIEGRTKLYQHSTEKFPSKKEVFEFASDWHSAYNKQSTGNFYSFGFLGTPALDNVSNVPEDKRKQILDELIARNITPTDQLVLTIYNNGIRSGAIK